MTAAERKRLARPFAAGILARAKEIALQYKLVIERGEEGGYVGSTVEMPLVMGGGRSIQACARDVMEATVAAVASMLERGESLPSPARDQRRDQQVNIRLTAEEKLRLESRASQAGYRSISDYVRAAALRAERGDAA